jgi:hypothetical protein
MHEYIKYKNKTPDRKCSKKRDCLGDFRCYVRRNLCIQKYCEDSSECPGDTICQGSINDIDGDFQVHTCTHTHTIYRAICINIFA